MPAYDDYIAAEEPVIGQAPGVVQPIAPGKAAARAAKKRTRDFAGFGGAGLTVMTALSEYVDIQPQTFALGVLVIGWLLSFAFTYARDRGWTLPTRGDGA